MNEVLWGMGSRLRNSPHIISDDSLKGRHNPLDIGDDTFGIIGMM
jgi:hypothetical protein